MTDQKVYVTKLDRLAEDRDESRLLIDEYLDTTRGFAGHLFNSLGENPPHELTDHDLLALNFLDVPIGPSVYRQLDGLRNEIGGMLRKLPTDAVLWEMKDEKDPLYKDADGLWSLLTSIDQVGTVTAHKIMARKRPYLIPILDRRVKAFFDNETKKFWLPYAGALKNPDRRSKLEALRPPGRDTSSISLLRILDIAIWMKVRKGEKEGTTSTEEFRIQEQEIGGNDH